MPSQHLIDLSKYIRQLKNVIDEHDLLMNSIASMQDKGMRIGKYSFDSWREILNKDIESIIRPEEPVAEVKSLSLIDTLKQQHDLTAQKEIETKETLSVIEKVREQMRKV
jgi:hypothetical protein